MAAHKGHPKAGGRGRNTPNKFSRERAERAAKQGPLPHEQMLAIARNLYVVANRYRPKEIERTNEAGEKVKLLEFRPGHEEKYLEGMKLALDANNKAAPYYAPRMAAVNITHKRLDPAQLTDEELDVFERVATRLSNESDALSDREGQTRH